MIFVVCLSDKQRWHSLVLEIRNKGNLPSTQKVGTIDSNPFVELFLIPRQPLFKEDRRPPRLFESLEFVLLATLYSQN